MSAIIAAKQVMRKEIKSVLHLLPFAEKQRQSDVVTQKLLNSKKYQESSRIALYLHMASEVHTLRILEAALADDKTCFIPHYIGSVMNMVRIYSMQDYDALPLTEWKIKQPCDDEVREDAIQSGGLDLIIVPGLGFTKDGARLGRGKAYYDTYLSKYETRFGKMPYTIALAYQEQIQAEIPMDVHDRLLDEVLYDDSKEQIGPN